MYFYTKVQKYKMNIGNHFWIPEYLLSSKEIIHSWKRAFSLILDNLLLQTLQLFTSLLISLLSTSLLLITLSAEKSQRTPLFWVGRCASDISPSGKSRQPVYWLTHNPKVKAPSPSQNCLSSKPSFPRCAQRSKLVSRAGWPGGSRLYCITACLPSYLPCFSACLSRAQPMLPGRKISRQSSFSWLLKVNTSFIVKIILV